MLELIKKTIYPYKYTVKTNRLGFRKAKQLKIEETATAEIFFNILNSLTREFGDPVFLHSYYGYIFERDNKFIACNPIEENYGCTVIVIFIFNKMPLGKKITYNRYLQVKDTIDSAITENGMRKFENIPLVYTKNIFSCSVLTSNCIQVILFVTRKEINYYISKLSLENKTTKLVPVCNGKEITDWNDMIKLKFGLNKIFKKANSIDTAVD